MLTTRKTTYFTSAKDIRQEFRIGNQKQPEQQRIRNLTKSQTVYE